MLYTSKITRFEHIFTFHEQVLLFRKEGVELISIAIRVRYPGSLIVIMMVFVIVKFQKNVLDRRTKKPVGI
jgi:hypothetical protein